MRSMLSATLLVLMLAGPASPPAQARPLARARDAYNEERYDAAIAEATEALAVPALVDSARLIIARAHLERYRQSAEPADLSQARDALRAIDASKLAERDHAELLVGLGEWLFFAERFGAAAELFANALARAESANLSRASRARMLDWWASATDRQAQRATAGREAIYGVMLERLEDELRRDPGSPSANYWEVVAARGLGNLERAWQSAMAGWVRAGLAPDRGASLRADIDRFVLTAIIPERAREAAQGTQNERQAAADAMVTEWERFKAEWEGGS
jgi:hypothetical protein